jgi:Ni,Fe-hydrogenase III small subunit
VCPTGAITIERGAAPAVVLDDGRCVMCGLCAEGAGAAFHSVAVEPAMGRRADLVRRFPLADLPAEPIGADHAGDDAGRIRREGEALGETVRRRFGRSAQIRHLDAGGCNGCEWELNQLQAPTYDLQRFGLDFVASPRHADILLVTGVVTRNLELALIRTLDAMPRPRLVLAMGACAISGGIFATSYASVGGADRVVAVDAYVAGCPPRPWAILRALRLLVAGA